MKDILVFGLCFLIPLTIGLLIMEYDYILGYTIGVALVMLGIAILATYYAESRK